MKVEVNKSLLPIKAHFFFFFAALGPLLPQMNVFGRQLGVSPVVMGNVTALLPLIWAAVKPLFGYVVDYWPRHRKLIFMMLISVMTGSYCCLWFLPMPPEPLILSVYRMNDTIDLKKFDRSTIDTIDKYNCHWTCTADKKFDIYLSNMTYINTLYVEDEVTNKSCSLYHMDYIDEREGQITCAPKEGCNLNCSEDDEFTLLNETFNRIKRAMELSNLTDNNVKVDLSKDKRAMELSNLTDNNVKVDLSKEKLGIKNVTSKVTKEFAVRQKNDEDYYYTAAFWGFVVLMCVGTVAFNVANCIGDAVCFDVLGTENGSKYGSQRAWGTLGYGLTALLGGWLMDVASGGKVNKDFTPAFIVALAATAVDLYSCRKLNLPSLSSPDDSGKALRAVLTIPRVQLFIVFAVVAGTFDSFIIYYMFWFLEELAETTGHTAQIKLIEGVVVAAQSFVGELLFFAYSGKIIKRFGYGFTMTFSLFCYGVRLVLISLIQNPWHLVFIESIMQGPTYALCYSTIVGYAAHVAPEGYTATVQGIVAGMDDGVGFALGSLLGGRLYSSAGGRGSFRIFAAAACVASLIHAGLFALVTRIKAKDQVPEVQEEGEKMLPVQNSGAIYRDTVVPLNIEKVKEETDR